MLAHRKIKNGETEHQWDKLKKTISKDIAFRAAEVIGEYSAEDMLDFSNISKSDINTIYVKHRDGIPMAAGIRKIMPNADIVLIHTERKGFKKDQVEITPLDSKKIKFDNNIKWFADPINARGTTSIEVLRYLYNSLPFDVALLSHIVANVNGINNIQTMITDFNMSSYMNYAVLSKKLNPTTGFLEDALEIIPDFGDKVFGTIGSDYSFNQMLDNLKTLSATHAGEVEKLRAFILLLLYGKNIYKTDKDISWSTAKWIRESILWYIRNRRVKIDLDFEKIFYKILSELNRTGFIQRDINTWIRGENRYKANDYYLTEEGIAMTHNVYVPFLEHVGLYRTILRDLNYVVHKTSKEISLYNS